MPQFTSEKRHFMDSILLSAGLIIVISLVFLLEKGLGADFSFLGVQPRHLNGLQGIVGMIFVHASLEHLFNNCFALFVLNTVLFYFYRELADKVFLLSWLLSGFLLWIIGREGSCHVGASGLVYALAFFLCVSGFIRRYIPLIAITFIVIFLYGNMIWHVFPWQVHDPISWEGHLSGALVGIVLAVIFRHEGPQRPVKDWREDEETEEERDLAEYAESFEVEGEKSKLEEVTPDQE